MTCIAVSELRQGRTVGARVAAPFPLRHPARHVHVVGPVRVLELRTNGDGSYAHTSGFVFGTGVLGVGLLAGSLIGNAAGNARRRAEAERNAQLAFWPAFDGDIFVTDAGFVLANLQAILPWDHGSVDMMIMVGPGQVVLQGQSDRGPITWQLHTPWAELVFAMWALQRHPENPQLNDGSWLPPGWLEWARSQGRDPWLGTPSVMRRELW